MSNIAQSKVYIFWDNSNIYIPAQQVSQNIEGIATAHEVRIDFDSMYRLAANNRVVKKAIAVGSVPPDHDDVWERLRENTGIEVELYERGRDSGKEQGVDQCLQTHMLRALADEENPQTAVLLTGDGAGYEDGVGFHSDIERMHDKGWGIEVLSWDHSCNKTLREWATRVGVFVKLDDYYKAVTFLKQLRSTSPLNMTHRRCAKTDHAKGNVSNKQFDAERQRAENAEAELARLREAEDKKRKYNDKVKKRGMLTKKKPNKGRR